MYVDLHVCACDGAPPHEKNIFLRYCMRCVAVTLYTVVDWWHCRIWIHCKLKMK